MGPRSVRPTVLARLAGRLQNAELKGARPLPSLTGLRARITAICSQLHVARKSAVDAVKAEADRYAANVLPIIREAQKAGAGTLREIAEALNARGIATARGGQWYAQSVANVPART
jgi:hypothetical protein